MGVYINSHTPKKAQPKFRFVVVLQNRKFMVGGFHTAREAAVARDKVITASGMPIHLSIPEDYPGWVVGGAAVYGIVTCWSLAESELSKVAPER